LIYSGHVSVIEASGVKSGLGRKDATAFDPVQGTDIGYFLGIAQAGNVVYTQIGLN
jgi:hypothetical protein